MHYVFVRNSFVTFFSIFLSLAASLVLAETQFPLNIVPEKNIVMITMAKSGSHLLMKCWYLLTGQISFWSLEEALPNTYPFEHFYLPEEKLENILLDPSSQVVVNIRDPRDICVSWVHHLIVSKEWLTPDEKEEFLKLSFDEQLLYVIREDKTRVSPRNCLPQVLKILKNPNILVCRFENLVGPLGGGSKELQVEEIHKILSTFEISLNEEEINLLADTLFGRSPEAEHLHPGFRVGKIGSWKKKFKNAHKRAFKKEMGSYLIQLGYEQNNQW